MPPKRKSAPAASEEPTPKRKTRHSGLLLDTQPTETPSKTRPSVNATPATTPSKRRPRPPKKRDESPSPGSLKENEGLSTPSARKRKRDVEMEVTDDDLFGHYSGSDSDDEILLSPSKRASSRKSLQLGTHAKTSTPKAGFDAVEIATPSKRTARPSQTAHRDRPSSPTPMRLVSPRKKLAKVANAVDEPPSPAKKRNRNSPATPPAPDPSPVPSSQPSAKRKILSPSELPKNLPKTLPTRFLPCFNAQRRAILRALHNPPDYEPPQGENDEDEDDEPANDIALRQLKDLLEGTVSRGEGNSCLLLGPRNSGKTRLVERCISELSGNPIIIRLSGWTEHNDRLAMREIAYQLSRQTGETFLSDVGGATGGPTVDDDDENPFIDRDADGTLLALPPPSHLPALISNIPSLPRATIVVLDAFDLFALHARQSLLYCLLDTVQSCRSGAGRQALAVIGVTTRIDTINMLEKRVKSRFSGRMIRTAAPCRLKVWLGLIRQILTEPPEFPAPEEDDATLSEWQGLWTLAVNTFLNDKSVETSLVDAFGVTRDVKMLCRILTGMVLNLSPSSPFPSASHLSAATAIQRVRVQFPLVHTLPYPSLCLLIAAMHAYTAGHETFTFEMLHETFCDQVRASAAAPVQINGGSIGMVRCAREVLMNAFEDLVRSRVFASAMPPSASVGKEFLKHRCTLEYEDVKKAIQKTGHMHLKKWMNKAQ